MPFRPLTRRQKIVAGLAAGVTAVAAVAVPLTLSSGGGVDVIVGATPTPAGGSCPSDVPGGADPFGGCWPGSTNTGVPSGTTLTSYTTPCTITTANTTINAKTITCSGLVVNANNLHITNSLIKTQIVADTGQTGLQITDSEIDCGCKSVGTSDTPPAIDGASYTLTRVNIHNAGHGAAFAENVTIKDTWIHDLGGNTEAHKDGIFGEGCPAACNDVIDHNNINCNDGPIQGCTAAIGLLDDFGDTSFLTITNNLLNTNGAACFYASGGPGKLPNKSDHLTFTGNRFGRTVKTNCGDVPVNYWDSAETGMTWSNNLYTPDGAVVSPSY